MIAIQMMPGTSSALLRIQGLQQATEDGLNRGWKQSGDIASRELVRILTTGPRTGRVYTFRGRKHQASAPGEPPALRTGRLAKSVDYQVSGWHTMVLGEEAEYAKFLEHGTRRMQPRPHLQVAVRNTQTVVMQELAKAIGEAHR